MKTDTKREDVIAAIVEDVRARAADYGFSYHGTRRAERLVNESVAVLQLNATDEEISEAIAQLA